MKFEFKPSFDKSLQNLDHLRKKKAKESVFHAIDFFTTKKKPQGLGLKRLRKNYWEIRSSIKDRIIFRLSGDIIEFVLVGSHNEIKNILKHL